MQNNKLIADSFAVSPVSVHASASASTEHGSASGSWLLGSGSRPVQRWSCPCLGHDCHDVCLFQRRNEPSAVVRQQLWFVLLIPPLIFIPGETAVGLQALRLLSAAADESTLRAGSLPSGAEVGPQLKFASQ